MTHASESQHWYTRDGSPQYTVKAKDGSERSATLRDARKMGLVPGVSTILGCCDKPGLNIWKIDQAIMAALTLPRIEGESSDSFVARVKVDAKETAKKAAERGTAIHAAIQGHFEGEPPHVDFWPHVNGAKEALQTWIGINATPTWRAEASFACPMGFGGKVDLSWSGGAVVDFKTKEFDEATPLKTWDEHAMQLAAYRFGLGMEKARAAIVYVSVTNPGLSRLIEIPEEDLQSGWRMFLALLQYWQAKQKFNSSWLPEQKAA